MSWLPSLKAMTVSSDPACMTKCGCVAAWTGIFEVNNAIDNTNADKIVFFTFSPKFDNYVKWDL